MEKKIQAIPFPDLKGKTVLDVGCDYGQFSFWSAERGAKVLGLDRNRDVKGIGLKDLIHDNNAAAKEHKLDCEFKSINLGKQWFEFGKFDIVYMFSLYHHIYENVGDHLPIWFWLWRHCREQVLWENPVDLKDAVSHKHVSREGYNEENILRAASVYFDYEYIGPAQHEPHRKVFRFTPKNKEVRKVTGHIYAGAGGASKAFSYSDNRRIKEIEKTIGIKCYPGSLNMVLNHEFDWSCDYYRAEILDVANRSEGLESTWIPRWARFYPLENNVFVFRFEGEKYPLNFVELISEGRLRAD